MGTKLARPPKIKARNRARPKSTARPTMPGAESASRESGGKPIRRGENNAGERPAASMAEPAPSAARSTAAPLHPFGEETPAKAPASTPDPVAETIEHPPVERKPGEPPVDEQIREIRKASARLKEARQAMLAARESAKAAREDFEAAATALERTVDKYNQELPLFDGPHAKPGPEEWRRVSIDELRLKPRVLKALHDFELETIGDLADFHADGGTLNRVKGLGEGAIVEVDDAMAKFWADHPGYVRPATEPEPRAAASAADESDSSDDGEDED